MERLLFTPFFPSILTLSPLKSPLFRRKSSSFLKKRGNGVSHLLFYPGEKEGKIRPERRIEPTLPPQVALIGFGCNLGDCPRRFRKLYSYLKRYRYFRLLATSPLYLNPPFGYLNQPHFWNGVLLLQTHLTPHQLLSHLLRIEKRFGRTREFKNAPRTLDLDLLAMGKWQISTPKLTLPHRGLTSRLSVQIPLLLLGKGVAQISTQKRNFPLF
ncbi:MAG: 2-amino-4-hydroxy-6-hydroxymethyldihydropteridine diphosphokinase [Epsilonproteobacteria bacterium]|nr:2-amino-4-hydroxy-6-hydroxymethyldihydropteridine diphosphokinase [Campylobacterota bacterium]